MVAKQLLNKENKNRWTTYTLLKDGYADSTSEEKSEEKTNVTDKDKGGQKSNLTTETSEKDATDSETGSEKNAESSEKSPENSDFGSEKTATSSEKILGLIKQNPTISATEIAKLIGMSSRGVEKHIRRLREAGVLKRIGADKGGYWEIFQ